VDNSDLVVLMITTVGSIGFIQLIVWAVFVMKDPTFDFLELDRDQNSLGHPNAPSSPMSAGFSHS
jgi:hypothetical protein